jgi:hypothetical protein
LEDYIVVDTEKALLICPRDNDQLIKNYVLDLKNFKKEKNTCNKKEREAYPKVSLFSSNFTNSKPRF